ncbi:4,5-DOPA-extradiol-dioxygenase [Govanella unica]|uniref:4,5-DOPA dioxygenase extradiol n=1 Tax=Govanella unica TaxID=2975056 RepID=A0A9X3Z813_9PROT|nr:4,5-DOPA dioxygenase extradiol [Govania unica]MDA5194762.1 4,5-DOPA dioxygenase extradiol [Govania unica]
MSVALPTVFIGHGSPMNALEQNSFTASWAEFGAVIARPKAILSISAHWYTRGSFVTAMSSPRTIHDFRGFPQALFDVQYPAPGAPEFAREVVKLLAPEPVTLDQDWGLDHGTWQVLVHMFPEANIPVVQLSINQDAQPAHHLELGRRLAPLRDAGVLILGSGNVVHNLGLADWQMAEGGYDWAERYNDLTRSRFLAADYGALAQYESDGPDAKRAIPTAEHYLPLLYVAGAARASDPLRVLSDSLVMGSLSMLSVQAG